MRADFLHINSFEMEDIKNHKFLNNIEHASNIISHLIEKLYLVNLEGENRELIKRINEIKSNIIKIFL